MLLISQYNVSPTTLGQIPPKGLDMAKRWTTPRICAIWHGMWPCTIWEQSWKNYGNPIAKSYKWKQFQKCLKTIPEKLFKDKCKMCWMPTWNNQMKTWDPSLVQSPWGEVGRNHLIENVK
jgi:hypothetical protein